MPTTELSPPASNSWRFKFGLLAIVLAAGFAVSLSASSRAQAAECMDLDECRNAGNIQKAVGDDYYKKGLWYQGAMRTDFVNAADWNNRAGLYFLAGQASNALWAKAVADDYSKRAVANSHAADASFAQARFWAAAADTSFRRYIFMAESPEYDIGTAGGKGEIVKWGWKAAKKANQLCKGFWKGLACSEIVVRTAEGVSRWVLNMAGVNDHCIKQKTRYDVNPSTGNVERVWHECTKWS